MTTATIELEDVRKAMATALKAVPGLNATAYQQSSPSLPTAHVSRGPITYDETMQGGAHRLIFTVTAYVSLADVQLAQALLDRYTEADGNYSIKQALEADPTLGGVIEDLHVTGVTAETAYNREQGGAVLASDWNVEVWIN